MWHVPPVYTAGISDIAMLTAWGRGQKPKQRRKRMQETREQRTGAHFWKCFHRVSKLISCTARAQPPCHEAFFIKSAYFWTLCCQFNCHWPGQSERAHCSSRHRWTPTANTCTWAPLLIMQRKVFLGETLLLFLELMEKIGQIICTQQVFVSFHPEVRRKDISHALHPAE